MKILIDNGHGENTTGKCSPDGRLKEWAYTREIADRVVAGLRQRGEEAERIEMCIRDRLLEDANGNYQKLEILGVCPVYLGVSRFILPIVALTLIGNGEMVFLLTVLH